MPDGVTFNGVIKNYNRTYYHIIKFIANSTINFNEASRISNSEAYIKINSDTIEIHTSANMFLFDYNCKDMFRDLSYIINHFH